MLGRDVEVQRKTRLGQVVESFSDLLAEDNERRSVETKFNWTRKDERSSAQWRSRARANEDRLVSVDHVRDVVWSGLARWFVFFQRNESAVRSSDIWYRLTDIRTSRSDEFASNDRSFHRFGSTWCRETDWLPTERTFYEREAIFGRERKDRLTSSKTGRRTISDWATMMIELRVLIGRVIDRHHQRLSTKCLRSRISIRPTETCGRTFSCRSTEFYRLDSTTNSIFRLVSPTMVLCRRDFAVSDGWNIPVRDVSLEKPMSNYWTDFNRSIDNELRSV